MEIRNDSNWHYAEMNIYREMKNRSGIPYLIIKEILMLAADYTGARLGYFPLKVSNRRNYSTCVGEVNHIQFKNIEPEVTSLSLSLPAPRILRWQFERSTEPQNALNEYSGERFVEYLLNTAKAVMSVAIHECQHVADIQNDLEFSKRVNPGGNRIEWGLRVEEVRANNAQHDAEASGYLDNECCDAICGLAQAWLEWIGNK